jgi:hypothetical protein
MYEYRGSAQKLLAKIGIFRRRSGDRKGSRKMRKDFAEKVFTRRHPI